MGECVDPALYPRVVVESVTVKVAELRDVPFQGGASKRRGNISFNKGPSIKDYQALDTLDKKHHVSVIDILAYQYYFAFSMRSIEVGVKVA